ncbi:MAG: hypothetical protein ACM3NQ_23025 [Bacteroidales bacterium]
MRIRVVAAAAVSLLLAASDAARAQAQFSTADLQVRLDARGRITSLYDRRNHRECLPPGQQPALVSVRAAAKDAARRVSGRPSLEAVADEPPSRMRWDAKTGVLTLEYQASGARVRVRAVERPSHIVFEVVQARPQDRVDAVVWGPYPTTIGAVVGEIVGVVRDDRFAIGLQVLNAKTRGGALLNAEGSDPSRGTLAQKAPFGSVLQAYALDRSRPRAVDAWNGQFPNMPVPPMPGETVAGSKIALFGSRPEDALERVGAIEQAEHVPHPMVDGTWVKQWGDQGRSYLIAAFSEATADELLEYTRRANLMTLYHPEPFASWGHYRLDAKAFPSGDAGLRKIVERARALGIRIGVHTLTNFINTNDAYVSPVPDRRLARTGSSTLAGAIDEDARAIPVASPEYFANEKANWLHTVVIGDELIRYRGVSKAEPWTLLECERGAFGTRRSPHAKGSSVGKLLDHPYNVFFPTLELQDEIAANLARWFNATGVGQLDFDGREGCLASGQGDYAQDRFAQVFYEGLDHPVLNGTSTSSPYYWHINTYCNWGEPWYGGFRESMQEYRIQNQALFDRNYVPNMLGWYRLTATTSLAEMEWMLARAAGFGAGFAMSTTLEELRQNTDTGLLLDTIREWERARRSGAFSPKQRDRLKDSRLEFHLETAGAGWRLYPFHDSAPYRHERAVRQPGEPTTSTWNVDNPDAPQPVQFRLQVGGDKGLVSRPRLDIDRGASLEFDLELKAGHSLVYDGGASARVYDPKGRQIATVPASQAAPRLEAGRHVITFDCAYGGDESPVVEVTFRTRGTGEAVAGGTSPNPR